MGDLRNLHKRNIVALLEMATPTRSRAVTIENGVALHIPGRDQFMPQLWRIPSHKKIPADVLANNILIYLEDTSPEHMAAKYKASKSRTLPRSRKEDICAAGYEIIGPGSYILCRDLYGSGKEEDDDIVMFIPATAIIEPFHDEMNVARDLVLGNDTERDLQKARLNEEGEWVGGIRFERSLLAVNVQGASRCYTLGQSYQVQRKLSGPAVGAKITGTGEILTHHNVRQTVMKASAAARVGIATLEAGDVELCEALRLQADVINLPALGDGSNYAFPTMQMNIAATQKGSSGSGSLASELGAFGLPHADENDSPAGMTVIIANSHLSVGVEPGFFLNVELGVAVELRDFVACCFSGLRQHGGYPPMDFSGNDPQSWSYRFVVVCYPPKQMMDGDNSLALGALPKQKLFQMPPEMIHPRYDQEAMVTNNATWIASGPVMTDMEAYLQWYYQVQCQQLAFFQRQVAVNSEMQVDLGALSKVFYFEDKHGSRTYPRPWSMRPEASRFPARAEAMKKWEMHKQKKADLLPYMYRAGRKALATVHMPTEEELKALAQKKGKRRAQKQATAPSPSQSSSEEEDDCYTAPPKKRQKLHAPSELSSSEEQSESSIPPKKVKKPTSKPVVPRVKARPRDARRSSVELPYQPNRLVVGDSVVEEGPSTLMNETTSRQAHTYNLQRSSTSFHLPERDIGVAHANTMKFSTPDYRMAEEIMDGTSDSSETAGQSAWLGDWYELAESEYDALHRERSLHFQPVLDVLSLGQLLEEFDYIQELASSLSSTSSTNSPEALEHFLQSYQQDDRTLPQFALQLSRMWPCHQVRQSEANILDLVVASERRQIMLSSAIAWYWLTQDCASSILHNAALLEQDPTCLDSTASWLAKLTRDVYAKLRQHTCDRLVHPQQYFPDCPSSMKATTISRHRGDCSPASVCGQVITILRHWLQFPTNSELLSAYFVLRLVETCGGNTDVLLLRGVWRPYKEIKAVILNKRSQRWSSLRLSQLQPFADALANLPLADPTSTERTILLQISSAIRTCASCLPSLLDVASLMHRMPGPYPLPSNNIPATATNTLVTHTAVTPPVIAPSVSVSRVSTPSPRSSSAPSHRQSGEGIDALVAFIEELLPLARGEAATSVMQQMVASNPDRYLPFRNLAPTRMAATSLTGPFHPLNISKVGSFASCVINRALTFNTPAALEAGNPSIFADEEAWDQFKAEHIFDQDTPASLAYFFKATCYGTCRASASKALEGVGTYFAEERSWRDLRAKYHLAPVPFVSFFKWATAQVTRPDKTTGGNRAQTRLPLVGKLTGYLLTADLSYASVVTSPTAEEVGTIIWRNKMGSLLGLVKTNQIGEDASQDEVVEGFKAVLQNLRLRIDEKDQHLIGLDVIMVEHLLCKFQRAQREVTTYKGKERRAV